jgi:hypothetical protein
LSCPQCFGERRVTFRFVLGAVFAFLLCGCATPSMTVRHDPPYRAEPHTSTIYVKARSESGIKRITVQLLVGELVACTSATNLSSMFPCRQNGYWLTYTCDFDGPPIGYPKEATCPVSRTLDSLTLLTYQARAVSASGRSASTNYITYSGGAPPPRTGARPPPTPPPPTPPPPPSAGDVLRPVWLESDDPPTGGLEPARIYWDMARRVDVAFLPDADWGADYRGFSDSAGEIAGRLLFEPLYNNPVPMVTADYFLWKKQFSYWVGPVGADAYADADDCTLTTTGWTPEALAVTDGQAIVHKVPFADSDCSLGGPGWGTVTAEPNAYVKYVHESGHFLFCMGDEYPGAGGPACSDPPNTFETRAACEQTATAYGFPLNLCVQIENSSLWRITDGSPEIMAITLPHPNYDWQDTNHQAFQRRMAACMLGACW